MALSRVGISKEIEDFDERSKEASICRRWFNQVRDELLRYALWSFATQAQPLALSEATFPGWRFVYQYPQDCIEARIVTDDSGARFALSSMFVNQFWTMEDFSQIDRKVPFRLAYGAEQTLLLTDLEFAWLIYTIKSESPAVWPSDFISALAWRLGFEVGLPLQAELRLIDNAGRQSEISWGKAAAANLNEEKPDPEQESPSVQVR
jgi:hypothetical protein